MKTPLCDLQYSELEELVAAAGEPRYRAEQLCRHIVAYDGFEEYTDLPKSFIAKLRENYFDRPFIEKSRVVSTDGATRYLFETAEGDLVEAVFLPHGYGNSVCVSCQVGCAMGCTFCASGYYGFKRNLSAGEILAQALFIARDKKDEGGVKKIVMMGSGEPLANYDNTVKFFKLLSSKKGLNIGMRSISISTCGLPDKIERLARDGFSGTLSLSLHAATDEKRKKIMRVANSHTVKDIVKSMRTFFDATRRRVVIEYILIAGFNDTDADVSALKNLLRGLCCHVNLIPLNPTDHCDLKPPTKKQAYAFCAKLNDAKISATVRRSMGSDVAGACGQLKNRTVEAEMVSKNLSKR
ncbi:MAG: 23S rRNA (adenine(2503)-C(2))-methyltransferase RlmN [Clostridiales bacterium]|nr:23S rRNA (adenine(2503)-C(2))-methyltransferase RlmN [Clostridiales bacterium]